MKALSTLVTAAAVASALAGCSVTSIPANETPCKTFESAYNQVDPGSKVNTGGGDYGVALKTLVGRIEPDARDVARGEVQSRMLAVVFGEARYRLSHLPNNALDAKSLEARENVDDTVAGVAKACKDSGFPITLKADHSAP